MKIFRKVVRTLNLGLMWLHVVILVIIGCIIALVMMNPSDPEGFTASFIGFSGGLIIGPVIATSFTRYFASKIWPSEEQLSKQDSLTISRTYAQASVWLVILGVLFLVTMIFMMIISAFLGIFLAPMSLVFFIGAGITYWSARTYKGR